MYRIMEVVMPFKSSHIVKRLVELCKPAGDDIESGYKIFSGKLRRNTISNQRMGLTVTSGVVEKRVQSKRSSSTSHATKNAITNNASNGIGRLGGIQYTAEYTSDTSALIQVTADELKNPNEVRVPLVEKLRRFTPGEVEKFARSNRSSRTGHATKKAVTEDLSNGTGRRDAIQQIAEYTSDTGARTDTIDTNGETINDRRRRRSRDRCGDMISDNARRNRQRGRVRVTGDDRADRYGETINDNVRRITTRAVTTKDVLQNNGQSAEAKTGSNRLENTSDASPGSGCTGASLLLALQDRSRKSGGCRGGSKCEESESLVRVHV
ncbi:hypothetical protein EDB85DRAFT_1968187 [Lactarius pseudohatsudake]|nr:hypothetical protein EDB85DRAFT_1968187 [Lactarius pseudohatsudake]